MKISSLCPELLKEGNGVNNYSWDARNQLVSITAADSTGVVGTQ